MGLFVCVAMGLKWTRLGWASGGFSVSGFFRFGAEAKFCHLRQNSSGLWGMTTSVIQQKGLPKDYFENRKGDSLVSQKWGETP